MTSALEFGGEPADPAVMWGGRTVTYGECAAAAMDLTVQPVVDISAVTPLAALPQLMAAASRGTAVVVRDPDLPAPAVADVPAGAWLVAFTSGSTGAPRAVYRTSASWAASVAPLARLAGLSRSDRVLLPGPLHSTLYLHAAVHTLAVGAALTDEAATATAVHCVPAVLARLLDELPADAPMRRVVVAGATLPPHLAAAALARGWSVLEYYGAAELSFVAYRQWDATPNRLMTPFPRVNLRIDDEGALWVRSPYLASGYLTAPPGCSPAVRPLRLDRDGFATVGDRVAAPTGDPMDGFVVRGRGEAAINTGGATVQAEEVEATLTAIPGVRAAAVIGLPHPRLGEVVAAALELDVGTELADVRRLARPLLSAGGFPRRYVVVPRLPRTASGKVDRAAVHRLRWGS